MLIHRMDYDPYLRPDWRFERVLEMTSQTPEPGKPNRMDDKYIKDTRNFFLKFHGKFSEESEDKMRRERDKLEQKMPGLYYAWKIYDGDGGLHPNTRFMLEARLLARQAYDRIAFGLRTNVDVIHWYEKVFFNVTPWLDAVDWIGEMVLNSSADHLVQAERAHKLDKSSGNDEKEDGKSRFEVPPVVKAEYDFTCKSMAYYGGEHLCDLLFRGFIPGRPCRSQDDIDEWLNETMQMIVRRRSLQAALKFDVNKYNVMELFQAHLRIIEIARGAEADGGKQTPIEKHIHAMLAELPWTVGKEARELFEGTAVGQFDEMAAELRDDELQLVAAGEMPNFTDSLPDIEFPKGKEAK